ncbi:MAG: hypothetical protein HC875_01490 [Anaerolineales bacterium]|nr:hypothetical protein [Anaerolineales bacterium]
MTLTPKERTRHALRHEPVDRIPTQINYTDDMGKILCDHFKTSPEELSHRLDNHLVRVDVSHTAYLNEDGSARYDWWG